MLGNVKIYTCKNHACFEDMIRKSCYKDDAKFRKRFYSNDVPMLLLMQELS